MSTKAEVTGSSSVWLLCILVLSIFLPSSSAFSQDTAKVVIETQTAPLKQPRLYSASAVTASTVGKEFTTHSVRLSLDTLQGTEGPFSLELFGPASVEKVEGDHVISWSVRREKDQRRFLDLTTTPETQSIRPLVTLRSPKRDLPAEISLSHIGKGAAASLTNTIRLGFESGVAGKILEAKSFLPLSSDLAGNGAAKGQSEDLAFVTYNGGSLRLQIFRAAAAPSPITLTNTQLTGSPSTDSNSAEFRLKATSVVTEPGADIPILKGDAAFASIPDRAGNGFQIRLEHSGKEPFYRLHFPEAGVFPLDLPFVARLRRHEGLSHSLNFSIGGEGVMPLSIEGLSEKTEFAKGNLTYSDGNWTGFLPAGGHVNLQWKPLAEKSGDKLFFTTSGLVETRIGAGLVRQTHRISYRVLQGKLLAPAFSIVGQGEIVSVDGPGVLSWERDSNMLAISLSEPVGRREAVFTFKTQSVLDALPARVSPLRLEPQGAVRHSGMIRLANEGGVRIDPSQLTGLTQAAPDKFPEEAIPARQVSVYRFARSAYSLAVAASRIRPEVRVSEAVLHHLGPAGRTLEAAVELDIREAPIREWDIGIPADYSVVSVSGAGVADYIPASDPNPAPDETRNLKIIFSGDMSGRKLIQLSLEKSSSVEAGDWPLPKLTYPDAQSIRGDLGLSADAGYRLALAETNHLSERPLSTFPAKADRLQHHFRIRQPDWAASAIVEILEKSIQTDLFHLYSLSESRARGSVLINYFITGAPASEFVLRIPEGLENVVAEGKDLRSQKLEDGALTVTLHQPVMGAFTLLTTFEQDAATDLSPGLIAPQDVQGESGYIQVVSPNQVTGEVAEGIDSLTALDHLELPPEFRLLSGSPSLGVWQYNARPFALTLNLTWLEPGRALDQVVEFAEASTLVSRNRESVTDLIYYVKSRDNRPFSLRLPAGAKIWDVRCNGRNVASRRSGGETQIPLLSGPQGDQLNEVRMRLGNEVSKGILRLPAVSVPVLKTGWSVRGEENEIAVLKSGKNLAARPVLPPSGFQWIGQRGLGRLLAIAVCLFAGLVMTMGRRRADSRGWKRWIGLTALAVAAGLGIWTAVGAWEQKSDPAPLLIQFPVLSAGEEVEVSARLFSGKRIALTGSSVFWVLAGLAALAAVAWRKTRLLQYRGPRKMLIAAGIVCLSFALLSLANSGWLFFVILALAIVAILTRLLWREMETGK